MKKTKLLSMLLSASLVLSSLPMMATAVSADAQMAAGDSIVLSDGYETDWRGATQRKGVDNKYLHAYDLKSNMSGVRYKYAGPLDTSKTYTFSFDIRVKSTVQHMQFRGYVNGVTGTVFNGTADSAVGYVAADGNWHRISFDFAPTRTDLNFDMCAIAGGDRYKVPYDIDNVSLVEKGTITNLIDNGDFENGELNGWKVRDENVSGYQASKVKVESDTLYSTAAAAGNTAVATLTDSITLAPGKYTIEGIFRNPDLSVDRVLNVPGELKSDKIGGVIYSKRDYNTMNLDVMVYAGDTIIPAAFEHNNSFNSVWTKVSHTFYLTEETTITKLELVGYGAKNFNGTGLPTGTAYTGTNELIRYADKLYVAKIHDTENEKIKIYKDSITDTELDKVINGKLTSAVVPFDFDDVKLTCDYTVKPRSEKQDVLNMIPNGKFNAPDDTILGSWKDYGTKMLAVDEAGNSYIEFGSRSINYNQARYDTGAFLKAGIEYTISYDVFSVGGQATAIRTWGKTYKKIGGFSPDLLETFNLVAPTQYSGIDGTPVHFEHKITPTQDGYFNFFIGGGSSSAGWTQSLGIDNFYVYDAAAVEALENQPEASPYNTGILMVLLLKKAAKAEAEQGETWTPTNIIEGASASAGKWVVGTQKLEDKTDEDGNPYIAASGITVNYAGFHYTPGVTLKAGTYTLSGEVRTSVPGEKTSLRMYVNGKQTGNLLNIGNEWVPFTHVVEITEDYNLTVKICGEGEPKYIQNYDIRNLSLVDVNEKAFDGGDTDTQEVNLFPAGSFDVDSAVSLWSGHGTYAFKKDGSNGYIGVTGRTVNYQPLNLQTGVVLDAGATYELSFDVRCAKNGESQNSRVYADLTVGGTKYQLKYEGEAFKDGFVAIDAWKTLTITLSVENAGPLCLRFQGGYSPSEIMDLDFDNVKIVKK